MVESVDTRDLKSLGHCGRTGSSPVPGTFNNTYELSGNKLVVKSGTTCFLRCRDIWILFLVLYSIDRWLLCEAEQA